MHESCMHVAVRVLHSSAFILHIFHIIQRLKVSPQQSKKIGMTLSYTCVQLILMIKYKGDYIQHLLSSPAVQENHIKPGVVNWSTNFKLGINDMFKTTQT